jgi:hypothetical protein
MHALFFGLQKQSGAQYYYFVVTALLLFIFATMDVAFLLRHVLDAFIWYKGGGHAIEELSILSYWVGGPAI